MRLTKNEKAAIFCVCRSFICVTRLSENAKTDGFLKNMTSGVSKLRDSLIETGMTEDDLKLPDWQDEVLDLISNIDEEEEGGYPGDPEMN